MCFFATKCNCNSIKQSTYYIIHIVNFQRSYGSSTDGEDQSSRASTPNEMTPSLTRQVPVHQDLCVSCIAAAAAAGLIANASDAKTIKPYVDEQNVSESKQVLSSSRDNSEINVQVQYSDNV